MSFRERQPLFGSFGAYPTSDKVVQPAENGNCEVRDVSNNEKLPDPRMTDLELQIKAGINLEQVNTKLIDTRSLGASLAELDKVEVKTDVEPDVEGEVKNED